MSASREADPTDFPEFHDERSQLESLLEKEEYGAIYDWYEENVGLEERVMMDDLKEEYPLLEDIEHVHGSYNDGKEDADIRRASSFYIPAIFGVALGPDIRDWGLDVMEQNSPEAFDPIYESAAQVPEVWVSLAVALPLGLIGAKSYEAFGEEVRDWMPSRY